MTTFKAFLKVLNRCKVPIIMYTAFLVFFGGFNMQTSDTNMNFVATKPDIYIVNNDGDFKITNNLIKYMEDNSNVIKLKADEDAINDAIFYRDVNFIIYIPKDYHKAFIEGKNPEIKIKSSGDYMSSLANMILSRYLKLSNIYQKIYSNEDIIISKINETLKENTKVSIISKLDTNSLVKATFYYNFLNYCIIAGAIYVICLILFSFHEEKVKKRTIISSTNYKKHNRILLLSNCLLAVVLWIFYVLLSIILIGKPMLSSRGLIYMLNSLIFTFCCVTIAFLISNLINNKNAINGIINVVALGSSFLCGAFVPIEYLPKSVLNIAHILPTYWYINSNELLKKIEIINLNNLMPIFINMIIIIIFSLGFIIISNLISRKKQKIV